MRIRKNDTVIIRTGAHKGKTGRVLFVNPKKNRVVVEGVNIHKRHQRPSQRNPKGGVVTIEGSIHLSNVSLFISGPNGPSPTRVGQKVVREGDAKRVVRFSKITGEEL